jgi:DNA-3-methyladenine glycosylase II
MVPPRLTQLSLRQGVKELVARDPQLAGVARRYGPPPLFARPRGFATLVWIILEQQVSLASARALFEKLRCELLGSVTPEGVVGLGEPGLVTLGFTRQKARYVSGLAARVVRRELSLERIARLEDAEAEVELLDVPGIGPWTAGVYLLMALRRPDVWPPGDLGLHKSMMEVECLPRVPSSLEAAEYALRWKPWRAVAARLLWHAYVSRRGIAPPASRPQR